MMQRNRKHFLAIGLTSCAVFASFGCQGQKTAEHPASSSSAPSAPVASARPAATTAPASHSAADAPVLVVWHTPYEGEPSTAQRLLYAAWADGIVLYRRDFPKAPQVLVVGRVEAADVQNALNDIDKQGFFRAEPFKFGESGTVIMARNKGRANTLIAARPFAAIPESQATVSPPSMSPHVTLWNTTIDSVVSLRETMDSEDLQGVADSNGMYRGYNSKNPSATWWFGDAGKLWTPSTSDGKAPASTKPAR